MNTEACEPGFESLTFAELPKDMKRMLRMQIKELVNSIEDCEFEMELDKLYDSRIVSSGKAFTTRKFHAA